MQYPFQARLWARAVLNGTKTLEEVPEIIRKDVEELIKNGL